jgi:hypothetical protein
MGTSHNYAVHDIIYVIHIIRKILIYIIIQLSSPEMLPQPLREKSSHKIYTIHISSSSEIPISG